MNLESVLLYVAYLMWLLGLMEAGLVIVAKQTFLPRLKETLPKNVYWWIVKTVMIVTGFVVAGNNVYELDILTRFNPDIKVHIGGWGIPYSPWYGTFISILIAAFFGEKIHDKVLPYLETKLGITLPDITEGQ